MDKLTDRSHAGSVVAVADEGQVVPASSDDRERIVSIVDAMADVVMVVDLDGAIRYQNGEALRLLGNSVSDGRGAHFDELVHPDDSLIAAAFRAAKGLDARTVELRLKHPDGTWPLFDVAARPIDHAGSPALVLTARDMTECRARQEQREQARCLKGLGRLAATIAHEFNNVLMGMQPFAELLQRADVTPQMISRGGSNIANSIQRGRRIVLDILRYAQPNAPVPSDVDLSTWWEGFAGEAAAVLGNLISVVSSTSAPDLCATVDENQLSQVMANLVTNARDAMADGGTLTVEISDVAPHATFPFGVVPSPGQFLRISVSDTGHGMTAEVMEHVFEPLFTTKRNGGNGLGLSIVHQIVSQHGGYVFTESTPGSGTTIHLFFPRAALPPPRAHTLATEATPAARKVLIIEDEEAIVEGLTMLLELLDMKVEAIGTGAQTHAALARFQPDLVLLDYGLPDMNGGDVYLLIREVSPSLPIIFCTGHGDHRTIYDNLHDARTRFLQKPFETGELLELMTDLETEVGQ
jgi:two-component system cell cycle sensor histidine kinase/response regulator CckA